MATNLIHYAQGDRAHWGVALQGGIVPLSGTYPTTRALIEDGGADWAAAKQQAPTLAEGDVTPLSPVTAPARVLCQGANYRQHMIESGVNPDDKQFNMFFEKSDASLTGARAQVTRPSFVHLLDYEIELALIFKRAVTSKETVTEADLPGLIFGFAIANDLSARDIQIPQMQFFKGKSYRGFCPIGPYLTVPDAADFAALGALDLHLSVNGQTRQKDSTANLVYKPAETIDELTGFSDIAPGDVLLTGTPAGCALQAPPKAVQKLMRFLLPEKKLWAAFKSGQAKRPGYLQPGDEVTATIRSADGAIDLGRQAITIKGA